MRIVISSQKYKHKKKEISLACQPPRMFSLSEFLSCLKDSGSTHGGAQQQHSEWSGHLYMHQVRVEGNFQCFSVDYDCVKPFVNGATPKGSFLSQDGEGQTFLSVAIANQSMLGW